MIFDTDINELVTDPPSGSHICPKCEGLGKIVGFSYWATAAEDCPDCNCNGWVINTSKDVEGKLSLDEESDIYQSIAIAISGEYGNYFSHKKLYEAAMLLGIDEIYSISATSGQLAYFIGVKRGIIKE